MKYQVFVYTGISATMIDTPTGGYLGSLALTFSECSRKELRSLMKRAVYSGDPIVEVHVPGKGRVFEGHASEALKECKRR